MIRLLDKTDIPKVLAIAGSFNSNFSKTYDIESYLNDDRYIMLVNEDDIVNAFLICFKNIDYYELEYIVVSKLKRKQGIASNLLDYFIKNYLYKNDEILLEVAVDNIAAIKLYQKYDFNVINTRKKYYNNIDAYVMKKVIK